MNTKTYLTLFSFFFTLTSFSQTLGGYSLSDNFVSTIYANTCFIDPFVAGPPSDSLWVNIPVGDSVEGVFGTFWNDHTGDDLLLETGYHDVNYEVKLLLTTGSYSSVHNVDESDWISIANVDWTYRTATCGEDSSLNINHYILPLDFISDFGLSPSDNVAGVHITFLATTGGPDLAGAYIISPPCVNTSSQLSVDVCESYTSPSGTFIWDTTGSYIDTIPNAEGCDSIIYIGLIVHDSVNRDVLLTGPDEITALEAGATYQWLKCPDMTIIPGATDQSYTALENGDYAVIVTKYGCVDTSECITIAQVIGLVDIHFNESVLLFPNPSEGEFTIQFKEAHENISITITNLTGKVVASSFHSGKQVNLNLIAPAGVYFVTTTVESVNYWMRLVLE